MRDEQLRSNQELTRPTTTGGNLVPVPARRSGAAQEDSYVLVRRHCERGSTVFHQAEFPHLKFFECLVAGVRAGDTGSLIVFQAYSNALRRHRQTHARALQHRFLDGPQPAETLQPLVFLEVTQPLKFARRVVSPRELVDRTVDADLLDVDSDFGGIRDSNDRVIARMRNIEENTGRTGRHRQPRLFTFWFLDRQFARPRTGTFR